MKHYIEQKYVKPEQEAAAQFNTKSWFFFLSNVNDGFSYKKKKESTAKCAVNNFPHEGSGPTSLA